METKETEHNLLANSSSHFIFQIKPLFIETRNIISKEKYRFNILLTLRYLTINIYSYSEKDYFLTRNHNSNLLNKYLIRKSNLLTLVKT
jgi:hypothetical protein